MRGNGVREGGREVGGKGGRERWVVREEGREGRKEKNGVRDGRGRRKRER